MITETTLLQYHLELGKWGYEHGPNPEGLSVLDRLQSLRTIQKAWLNPQPKRIAKKTINLDDMSDTAIGLILCPNAIVRYVVGNDMEQVSTRIDLIKVSASVQEFAVWSSIHLKIRCTHMCVDLEQDLLAVTEPVGWAFIFSVYTLQGCGINQNSL